MLINFFVSNIKKNIPSELLLSNLASTRLRVAIAYKAAIDSQDDINVMPINSTVVHGSVPDVLFVGKFVPQSGAGIYYLDNGERYKVWVDAIDMVHAAGGRVILDYTDHHLLNPNNVGDFYRAICERVSTFVVPSKLMAKNLSDLGISNFKIIPEPIEVPFLEVRTKSSNPTKALWFGHNSNLIYLYKYIIRNFNKLPPIDLIVMTDAINANQFRSIISQINNGGKCIFIPWTLEKMIEIAMQADLVLIPSDPKDPRKNGVSPGRLLTALALGLPVAASSTDSYLDFRNYYCDLEDNDMVSALIANPLIMSQSVSQAQKNIKQYFSIESICSEWTKTIKYQLT